MDTKKESDKGPNIIDVAGWFDAVRETLGRAGGMEVEDLKATPHPGHQPQAESPAPDEPIYAASLKTPTNPARNASAEVVDKVLHYVFTRCAISISNGKAHLHEPNFGRSTLYMVIQITLNDYRGQATDQVEALFADLPELLNGCETDAQKVSLLLNLIEKARKIK